MSFLVKFHSSELCFSQTGWYSSWFTLTLMNLENPEDGIGYFAFYCKNPNLVTWSIAARMPEKQLDCLPGAHYVLFWIGWEWFFLAGLSCKESIIWNKYHMIPYMIPLHHLFLSLSLTKVWKIGKKNPTQNPRPQVGIWVFMLSGMS